MCESTIISTHLSVIDWSFCRKPFIISILLEASWAGLKLN